MLGSARAEALSYSAVKLFSKYSNLCDHGGERFRPTDRQTDGRTDRRHTVISPRSASIARYVGLCQRETFDSKTSVSTSVACVTWAEQTGLTLLSNSSAANPGAGKLATDAPDL